MRRYITVDRTRFLIRGQNSASELRLLYAAFVKKFAGTKTTFRGWLVGYGKVYCKAGKDGAR